MKRGIYGKYKNKEYEITRDMENNVLIMTRDINKIDETFKDKYNSGLFKKIVEPNELSDCISITPYGIKDGEKVEISKEMDGKYQVATSDFLVGTKLNLPRIDRDLWLGWLPVSDVTLVEEEEPLNPYDLV